MPIKRCECKADLRGNTAGAQYQDRVYGQGMRVHTDAGSKTKEFTSRCTVCGKTTVIKRGEVPESKKAAKNAAPVQTQTEEQAGVKRKK